VLVFHAAYYSRVSEPGGGVSPYLARLNIGVAVFFVISGFLLYRPLLAARARQGPPVRLRDYARRRVLRIVPAYWVALTVLAIYPGLTGVFSGRWWVYYGFGQDYGTRTVVQGIGPAWSLGCEVVFYALLPFVSRAFGWAAGIAGTAGGRAVWWQLEVAVLGLLSAASFGVRALAAAHPGVPASTFATTFAWFAVGMALAVFSVCGRAGPRAERFAWLGWVAAAGAYVAICRGLGLPAGNVLLARQSAAQQLWVYGLSGVVAAGLALPAVLESPPRSPVGRFLAAPVMSWLGLISYGIYLYHEPVARALAGGLRSGGASWSEFVWLTPATAAIALTAGGLSYYIVERPLLALKDGWAVLIDVRGGGGRSRLPPA
jgi:peptidoglycan/LPS O-acetylase OafA/YrhL